MALAVGRESGIRCVYQPIVALGGGGIIGYEALARVPGRDLAQVLRGMSREDARAFDAGMASRALWGGRRLPAGSRLFVNVTAATLQAVLEGAPWPRPPHRLPGDPALVWEIPESRAGTALLLRQVAAGLLAGVEVALDDLGEGDSDLRRLASCPGAWAKLGRRLVQDCDRDPARAAVIGAVVRVAGALGGHVVAEGVERAGEGEALEALGVRYAQGFHFGAPSRHLPGGAGESGWGPRSTRR